VPNVTLVAESDNTLGFTISVTFDDRYVVNEVDILVSLADYNKDFEETQEVKETTP